LTFLKDSEQLRRDFLVSSIEDIMRNTKVPLRFNHFPIMPKQGENIQQKGC